MTDCTITFYAGAAEAAGGPSRSLTVPDGSTLAELVDRLGNGDNRLSAVLKVCTVLVDGRPAAATEVLPAGTTSLDVLPPFAGG